MVRTEMVKELARLDRDGSGDFTLRTGTNSYVFIRRGFSPLEGPLIHCHAAQESRSLPWSSDSSGVGGRTRTRIWSGNGSGFTPPAPADRSPLSLLSDPHIPHSVHLALCPALLCHAMLLVLWPPQGNTSSFSFYLLLESGFLVKWAQLCHLGGGE